MNILFESGLALTVSESKQDINWYQAAWNSHLIILVKLLGKYFKLMFLDILTSLENE